MGQQMQQHSAEAQVQQFLQDRSYLPTQANTQIPAMNLMASPYEGPFQAPTKLPIPMSETLPDPKFTYFNVVDESNPNNVYRPDSPALTPIVPPGDSLSIVSN